MISCLDSFLGFSSDNLYQAYSHCNLAKPYLPFLETHCLSVINTDTNIPIFEQTGNILNLTFGCPFCNHQSNLILSPLIKSRGVQGTKTNTTLTSKQPTHSLWTQYSKLQVSIVKQQFERYYFICMLATRAVHRIQRSYRHTCSRMVIHTKLRWLFTFCLTLLYLERSYGMSYYIVTYLIGFYLLQLVVEYLTPKGLEESEEEDLDDVVPIRSTLDMDEDATPLASKMDQFKIWERVSVAFTLGLVCTCFKLLQTDVFWPLLVIYFLLLVGYTIRKVLRQMNKHSYSWTDFYKK